MIPDMSNYMGVSIAKLREHLDNRGKIEVTARYLYLSVLICKQTLKATFVILMTGIWYFIEKALILLYFVKETLLLFCLVNLFLLDDYLKLFVKPSKLKHLSKAH